MDMFRTLTIVLVAPLIAQHAISQERNTVPDAEAHNDVAKEYDATLLLLEKIVFISERGRFLRQEFIDSLTEVDAEPTMRKERQAAFGRFIFQIDQENTAFLKGFLLEHDWEEVFSADPVIFQRVFEVVQHSSDKAFQAQVLAQITPFLGHGSIDGKQYALLYDRVQLGLGKQQKFGTQLRCQNGKQQVYDLVTPDQVDQRRAVLGLSSLSDYLDQAKSLYPNGCN